MTESDKERERDREKQRVRERERETEREYINGWREALRRDFIRKTFYDCVDYSPFQFPFNYES